MTLLQLLKKLGNEQVINVTVQGTRDGYDINNMVDDEEVQDFMKGALYDIIKYNEVEYEDSIASDMIPSDSDFHINNDTINIVVDANSDKQSDLIEKTFIT